jgi:hypothetical protein
MDFRLIGAISFIFTGFTILNRILEGMFITAADMLVVKNLTVFYPFNVFGLFEIPLPNLSFFTTGIPKLIQWDYSFFGGPGMFIQYGLYSLSAAVMFGCILTLLGIGISYLANKLL